LIGKLKNQDSIKPDDDCKILINFLFGAGLSRDYLNALNNIERDITQAQQANDSVKITDLKKEYFEESISGNIEIVDTVSIKANIAPFSI